MFFVLRRAFRLEGLSIFDLYRFDTAAVGRDILAAVVVFIILAPLSYFPNILLATALFGNADAVIGAAAMVISVALR